MEEKKDEKKPQPHRNHRERMRQRFSEYGFDSFAPHEQVEYILFYSVPQGNTNPIAHELLDKFHSLAGVVEAPAEELMKVKGVGRYTVDYLKLIPQLSRAYEMSRITGGKRMARQKDIAEYLKPRFIGLDREVVYLMLMDSAYRVLFCDKISEGSVIECSIYMQPLIGTAAEFRAVYAVLAHNHPSGNCYPSKEDFQTTSEVFHALQLINVHLIDHCVFGAGDYVSLNETEAFDFDSGVWEGRSLMVGDTGKKLADGEEGSCGQEKDGF